jgi:hypothetical protein
MQKILGFLALSLLLGCATPPPTEPEPPPTPAGPPVYLEPTEQLLRASMALRGLRPSADDWDELAADPGALEAIVDRYLDSDAFGLTIRDMHAETFLMRSETVQLPTLGPLAGQNRGDVNRSLAEAPLMLIEDIVLGDAPYTDIVTADYMMADSRTSKAWADVEYNESGPEWQVSHWPETRPKAGILSTSELWVRHISNGSNYHRQRANLIADTLLCATFLDRDIPLDGSIDLSDPAVVADAVLKEKVCVGCHQALDPLASSLWGFRRKIPFFAIGQLYAGGACDDGDEDFTFYNNCLPLETYNPAAEVGWQVVGTRPPGYYGLPAGNLEDIGQAIAADPRFSLCAARRFSSYLTQTPIDDVPFATVAALQERFIGSNYNAKDLAKAIVLSDTFLAAEEGQLGSAISGLQIVRPEQYARLVEDLTGFVWEINADRATCAAQGNCWGDVDLGLSDAYGFRSMAGGIDGYFITKPTHTATPVRSLYTATIAKEAAAFAVEADFAQPDTTLRSLLRNVEDDHTGEETIRVQLQALHLRILGEQVETDSTEVTESYVLWESLRLGTVAGVPPDGDIPRTWSLLISAMLRDVKTIYY